MKRAFWLLTLSLMAGGVLAQSNPFAGTWKLNVDKTTLSSGRAQPVTMIITVNGDEESMRAETAGNLSGYTARYDGKDYPMMNLKTGQPTGVMTALIRIDARTVDRVEKRDGKITSTTRRVLSPDAKVMTSTTPSSDKDGQSTTSVRIWEKQ